MDTNTAKHMKKRIKTYYIGLNKATNEAIIATSKTEIAKFLCISVDTLDRRLNKSDVYIGDKWSVWCNLDIKYRKTGFAL